MTSDNTVKLFSHDVPALIFFYDPSSSEDYEMAAKALEYVFGEVQDHLIVLKANMSHQIC
jgi:hypothetical protein